MKLKVNYFVDVTMLVGFFACAITGVLKFPELNVQMSDGAYLAITTVNDWTGIASLALAAVHVLLHAKWFANSDKNDFHRRPKKCETGERETFKKRGRDHRAPRRHSGRIGHCMRMAGVLPHRPYRRNYATRPEP
jgi:hypothetical protein